MVNQKSKNRVSFAFSEASIRAALSELIRGFGHDPALITTDDLQGIADRLSAIAGKKIPWGWRYLRNVLNEKVEPSTALTQAIMSLGATFDGVPEIMAQAHQVSVMAVGNIKSGSLILADSKPCDNPACPIEFVPRVPWQRYHSKECARNAKKNGGSQ
jgi:hypothetical protein